MNNTNLPLSVASTYQFNSFKHKILKFLLISPNSYISKKVLVLPQLVEELKWKKRLQDAGITEADTISTWTRKQELQALYNLASTCSQGSVALEIGAYLGASSCYIAAGLAQVNGHLLCVDTWHNETMSEGGRDTFAEFHKNINGVKQRITTIRKKSDDVTAHDIRVPLNLVFIDGDHSYISVKKDFDLIQQWLAEDAIVAFHDFSCPNFEGVTRVVGEALASGSWMIVGQVDTLVWLKRAEWSKPTWINEI